MAYSTRPRNASLPETMSCRFEVAGRPCASPAEACHLPPRPLSLGGMPTEPIAAPVAEAPLPPAGQTVPSPAADASGYPTALAEPPASRFRWVVLTLVFFAITINYIDRLVMGILAGDLQKLYQINDIQYGYIQSAFALSYAAGQLASGAWLDRVGTRIGYTVSLLGWCIASMLHALARGPWGFGIMR